jgi:membrane associated rhomboid family serine protease
MKEAKRRSELAHVPFVRRIAAATGAFLTIYPRDRIRTVVLLGYSARIMFIPAVILVGLWFLTQLFSEIGALAQVQSGGVADMAQLGGFAFGALECDFVRL